MNEYVVIFNATTIDPSVFDTAREMHQDIVTIETFKGTVDKIHITFRYHRAFEMETFIKYLRVEKHKNFYDRYTPNYKI